MFAQLFITVVVTYNWGPLAGTLVFVGWGFLMDLAQNVDRLNEERDKHNDIDFNDY